ncbi:MAG: PrsW family intramembrane metalloprotease [Proteobacteria bacterium]|nr:PrsW family intramembrane metalloprotease [Pseudomonadota bacterium]
MDPQRPGGEPKRPGGAMNSPRTGESTRSQLLPIAGQWSELPRKPYFLPGAVLVVVSVLLFSVLRAASTVRVMYDGVLPVDVPLYSMVLAGLISAAIGYMIYRMAGKPRTGLLMAASALLMMALMQWTPLIHWMQTLAAFGTSPEIADGDMLPTRFVKMLFAAGLPEELMKAVPVALAVLLAVKLKDRTGPLARFAVEEPLDALLIGAAAGLGFAFFETMFLYVPRMMMGGDARAVLIYKAYLALAAREGPARAALDIQGLITHGEAALQLLIPRLLSDIAGHAAYAGIFGYYIGLAFLRPANRAKTLIIGLAVSAGLHAAWDAGIPEFAQLVVALASFAALMACIAKAREISPNRNRLVASQIVDGLSRLNPAGARPAPVAPAAVPSAAAPTRAAAPAAAPSMTWGDESTMLTLEIGTARIPATPGARLYARQAPGTVASNGDNVVGEVNANPHDPSMLGIKNLSTATWHVTTDRGEQREIATGRSVRLARGMTLRIGDLVARVR